MATMQTGKIAKGDSFLGRDTIIKELETYLGIGQSVVLIAPRRFGKSSIINKVVENNTFGFNVISVDIMKVHNKRLLAEHLINEVYNLLGLQGILLKLKASSIELFKDIVNHLTSLKLTINDIGIETTEKLLKETDEDKLLTHALELPELIAQKLGVKILFIIDEFGEIDKMQSKNELIDKMRAIFQDQENVIFLFAGSQYTLMTKIFIDKNAAFYKFAVSIEVPVMTAKDFHQSFRKLFFSRSISIPNDFAQEIEAISQGIPYYMVRIAQQVLVDALIKGNINTYCYSIRVAALKVFKREQSYFESELTKFRGKKHDMRALIALSNGQSHYEALKEDGVDRQNANAVMRTLITTGIVEKKTELMIVDPFMCRYIKRL